MSVTSRSSSINSNKRRIDEIDDTIEYLTNEVKKCDDFALKSDFESSLLALKLRREKVKALAAAARTQILLADMEVLIAESDLLSDVERLKKYKKNKLDGGKDEPQASRQESRKRTTKSTSVQTSSHYRTERKKRKHSESRQSSKHSERDTLRSLLTPITPNAEENSHTTCKDYITEPSKSTQASPQNSTQSTAVQTSSDNGNEHHSKKMKYSDSRCSLTQSDTETVLLQLVPRSPSAEKIPCSSLKNPTELLIEQECTQIPESTSTEAPSACRNEHEYEFSTSKLIDAIHSPMHVDTDMLELQSYPKSPITEKESQTSRKDGSEPLEEAYDQEHEYKDRKPNDLRRTPINWDDPTQWDGEPTHWDSDATELQSIPKSPIVNNSSRKNSLNEPMELKVITGYTSDKDLTLSSPLKAEFAKPYPIKQSQDIRKLQTDADKVTLAPQLKEKKKKRSKNKKKHEKSVPTKPANITTKTCSEINRKAFSPKPNPYNALMSYHSQNSVPTNSTRAPMKHILPLMIPRPPPLGPCLGMGNSVPQTSIFQSTTGLRRSPGRYNFYYKNK